MNRVFRRLYLLRGRAALLLCLPGFVLVGWYGFEAFARFDAYRRADDRDIALDLSLFQLELHDVLRRDLARIAIAAPPDPSKIPHLALHIRRSDLNALLRSRHEKERDYVPADLVQTKRNLKAEVRLLGERPWHVLYKQLSLKVQMDRGDLVDGARVFTLSNDPSPMVVGEQLIVDLLGEHGVLVPRSDFARLTINDTDLGVFRYEAQPDESLLRMGRRQPGSMFSGDLSSSAPSDALWRSPASWKKVAWREEESKEDVSELEHLLAQLRDASVAEFADFARNELDLDAFAAFEAIDIAFGCDQHNYRENHKLYFDPYRGRWEPVAWGFRGFEHDPVFERVENPLTLRLKQVPGYLSLRNRALYELLMGKGSGSAVRARGVEILRRIGPDLVTDPYWDAYRLLPRVTDFHRQMVRPMNMERALLVFDSELTTYQRRRDFLLEKLRANPLWLRSQPGAAPDETLVELFIDGDSGVALQRVELTWPASCTEPSFQLFDRDRALTPLLSGRRADLDQPLPLAPSVGLTARTEPDPDHGAVQSGIVPTRYALRVQASCVPERVEAEGLNLSTLARVRARPVPAELLARLPARTLAAGDVPRFAAGEVSSHPWLLGALPSADVTLGPGSVEIAESRVFSPEQRVKVAAGTRLRMAPGVSLVFLGPVQFEGTAREPIAIEPSGKAPWGGLALQGKGSSGSRLSHVSARGGSAASHRRVRFPGMITLHDTRDVLIDDCHFGGNTGSDDVVHASYVHGLRVEDTTVVDAHADAWDLELSDAVLRRVQVGHTGDDALDLMGSRVELADAVLVDLKGHGVSAGEQSDVNLHDMLIADAAVGLLAKTNSRTTVDGSLIFRAKTGVRVYTREVRYEGESRVQADVLFVVGSELPVRRDDQSEQALDIGRIQLRLPRNDTLANLRENVLALPTWSALPEWVGPRLLSLRVRQGAAR